MNCKEERKNSILFVYPGYLTDCVGKMTTILKNRNDGGFLDLSRKRACGTFYVGQDAP